MNSYHNILDKLKVFTQRYYTKMLIKGVLLFAVLGLLFFLGLMAVEYYLWLGSSGRLFLLLLFIGIELVLIYRYIAVPLFYLFRVRKGISNKQASLMIGKHFSEVDDKLYNLLDLAEDTSKSELLLASIEQRSERLDAIPFSQAVDYRDNVKYAKYLLVPIMLFGIIWITGELGSFFGSAGRVVNYDLAYEPPAPFRFELVNKQLKVLDAESYTIEVVTVGDIRPDAVFIGMEGKESLLQEDSGRYRYTFSPPLKEKLFYFRANGVQSREYRLEVLKTPSIQDFTVRLDFPKYTGRNFEILNGTGNATFPEGTKATWQIEGRDTETIHLRTKDTILTFGRERNAFRYSKRLYADFGYELVTSNANVEQYEKLAYTFKVVKDAFPKIRADQVLDSLNPNVAYFMGEASDDYKLSGIRLVCYPDNDEEEKQVLNLSQPNTNVDQFYYTFPSGLQLNPGTDYSFFFEAIDNDAIHGGKRSKTQVFSLALLNEDQLRNKELESQQSIIGNMDKSLEKFKEQKQTLQEINKEQKEKKQLNFNDQNEIKDFLKKQQQQESMMQKFSKQLKENLEKSEKDDELNKLLQERLERQEKEARKNEKLLEELNKIADKINKEELAKKLEELGKKQQNSQRSLEQLLELTKRYYVTEKAAQIAKDLEKLAERQEYLSEIKIGQDFSNREQEKLNEEFEEISGELKELEKDNQDLKKPLELSIDKNKEEGVKKDQQEALEQINKHEGQESSSMEEREKTAKTASQKQKSAANKMKELSQGLQQASSGGASGSSVSEDAEMLRQILDNLVTFSFKQEKLFENLEDAGPDMPQFSGVVKRQQELKGLFEHVDDSLFALSLRQAELSEFVNEQITEVYYNIDKSLESLAESQVYQGVSYQKYVLSASNSLADFLAKLLDNMNQSMQMGQGSGESQEGFQLPDIIQQQQGLKDKMEGMGQSGKGKPQQGEGEGKGKQGAGENEGGEGKSGQEGNTGEGKAGKDGKGKGASNGEGEGEGENGKGKGADGNGGNDGEGSNGQGGNGVGQATEAELQEIYEIYKQQQQLRQQLEQQLQGMINNSDRKLWEKLIRQMEDFENDLLENGFTQRSMAKVNTIQYELLKLENAAMKQGKKPEREGSTNTKRFSNPITTKPALLENFRNEVEILNRQALPLRPNFKEKVKDYFKGND